MFLAELRYCIVLYYSPFVGLPIQLYAAFRSCFEYFTFSHRPQQSGSGTSMALLGLQEERDVQELWAFIRRSIKGMELIVQVHSGSGLSSPGSIKQTLRR